jgi:hypothetical protein
MQQAGCRLYEQAKAKDEKEKDVAMPSGSPAASEEEQRAAKKLETTEDVKSQTQLPTEDIAMSLDSTAEEPGLKKLRV